MQSESQTDKLTNVCTQERLDVQTERNGVQMLMQAVRTRVCAHLYAERSRDIDVKMTDGVTY